LSYQRFATIVKMFCHGFRIYEKMTGHVCEQIPFSIRTSLGCKFKCKFCSGVPNWLNYRKKSRTRIEKELESFDKHVGG
ncbi:hypothetical protein, partial [Geobacillus sp. AYS3]